MANQYGTEGGYTMGLSIPGGGLLMQLENLEKAARAAVYLDNLENLKANFTREECLVENVRKLYQLRKAELIAESFPEIRKICQDSVEKEIERIKKGVAEL